MYNITVLGATGLVGQKIIEILQERNFPIKELYPLASSRSVEQNKKIQYKNNYLEVIDVEKFDFTKADFAFFSAGKDASIKYAPIAAAKKCVVIDNTSAFRNDPEIPLIIPEVNAKRVADFKNKYIISNPNCSTIQMLVALKPIYDKVGIKKINISTYQAVSGSGNNGIDELLEQTEFLLSKNISKDNSDNKYKNIFDNINRNKDTKMENLNPKVYSKQIAFNALPHIDQFMENGYTKEEMKMVWETKKILEDDSIEVNPTAVRIPVINGHSESINIETANKIEIAEVIDLLKQSPGISCIDNIINIDDYPSAVTHADQKDNVYVGRLRRGIKSEKSINMWVVADNIRKGAALNSVQIAEILINNYY